jgi:hypothetical protein
MATINIAMANNRRQGKIQRVRVFQVAPATAAADVELKLIADAFRFLNRNQATGTINTSSKRNHADNG